MDTIIRKPADVAIWGRIPPPIGGMSVHLSRLLPLLQEENISSQMYNLLFQDNPNPLVIDYSRNRSRWIARLFFGRIESVHYVMGARLITRIGAALLEILRSKKVILRVGGKLQPRGHIAGWLERKAFCSVSCVIGVNQQICDELSKLGVDPTKIHHVPGFIPPIDDGSLPRVEIVKFARDHSPVLLSSGQALPATQKDIWGMRMIPKLIQRLVPEYPNIGMICCLYRPDPRVNDEPINEIKQEIRERRLNNHIFVEEREGEFWPIFKESDMLVRPSVSDGDSNAIREAIHFGLAVVASDCVPRPEPVVTFPSGEVDLLCEAVRRVVNNLELYKDISLHTRMRNNGSEIVKIMKNLVMTSQVSQRLVE